ncbi:MAG: sulfurtransferase TusA family protein [Gammaproteobacteria bacterium]|nr:MAG: sulfurtransferase TusA family protein [Gammaproteobacteria bacterium]
MSKHALDARGLLCPLPVIRTQERVAQLAPGDILEVTATDPGVLADIPAWCRVHGHQVLETRRNGNLIVIALQVTA